MCALYWDRSDFKIISVIIKILSASGKVIQTLIHSIKHEPPRKQSYKAGQRIRAACLGIRAVWLGIRAAWLGIRAAWPGNGAALLGIRAAWLGIRTAWLGIGAARPQRRLVINRKAA